MDLSTDSRAILLLTGQLGVDPDAGPRPLTWAEYGRLARQLFEYGAWPSDLLGTAADGLLARLDAHSGPEVDRQRLGLLLGRAGQLERALDRWQGQSIRVTTRADEGYPRRLRQRMGHGAPPALFHCGNPALLDGGGLAVVGSRRAEADVTGYARHIGELAAGAACTVVSGGARGVDRSAMDGAMHRAGPVAGILPQGLEGLWWARVAKYREALAAGNLCLCSPWDPAAGWQAWRAMERNHLIYALSDAALVVQSDAGRGGTWAGAREQILKLRHVPVFVRAAGRPSAGLDALRKLGAGLWSEPADSGGFADTMRSIQAADGNGARCLEPEARRTADLFKPDDQLRSKSRFGPDAAIPSERPSKGGW